MSAQILSQAQVSAQILSQAQDKKNYHEMVEAAKAKDFDKIRAFFKQEKNRAVLNKATDHYGSSLFTALIQEGIPKHLLKFLIKKGADINYFPPRPGQFADKVERFSPLTAAITAKNNPAVEVLIDNHVEVNAAESLPLQKAAETGNLHAVKLLIERGRADVNFSEGYTHHLMDQTCGDTEEELEVEKSYTALMVAAQHGFSEIVAYLLQNKASINIVAGDYPDDCVTVLNLAFAKKNEKEFSEIWEMLINHAQEMLYRKYRAKEGLITECLKQDMSDLSGEASNSKELYTELEPIIQSIALKIYDERGVATASIPVDKDQNVAPIILSHVADHQPTKEITQRLDLLAIKKAD